MVFLFIYIINYLLFVISDMYRKDMNTIFILLYRKRLNIMIIDLMDTSDHNLAVFVPSAL